MADALIGESDHNRIGHEPPCRFYKFYTGVLFNKSCIQFSCMKIVNPSYKKRQWSMYVGFSGGGEKSCSRIQHFVLPKELKDLPVLRIKEHEPLTVIYYVGKNTLRHEYRNSDKK